ncbi:MAG: glycosyltransferase family 39 protein [Gammaproteobacteria bacterium]|nr:glycosyltransferase family 39 protein [Gammaproteobacteria bacterium]
MRASPSNSLVASLSSDSAFRVALVGIVLLAAMVRLHQLGADDLWTDETFSGFLALTPEWVSYLRIDNTPPLYYLVLRLWCGVASCGELGLRLPSALAGVAFVALVGVFFKQAFGRGAALAVALIAALSPVHVYYSQEARVYSILLTTLLLFLFLQWRVIHRKATTTHFVLLFITGVCALYLHYLSAIAIGAYALVCLVEKASGYRDIPGRYFVAVAAAFACFVPWALAGLLGSGSSSSELAWIAEYFEDKPLWQLPLRTLTTFLTGPELYYNEINLFLKRHADMDMPAVARAASALLTFLVLVLCLAVFGGFRGLSGDRRRALLESAAFVILPLLGLAVASLVVAPVYVAGRYDLIAFPGFLMLGGTIAGMAFDRAGALARPGAGAALGVLLVALVGAQAYKLINHRLTPPHSETVAAETAAAAGRLGDGDGLLVARQQAAQVWYYLHRLGYARVGGACIGPGKRFTCRLFPRDMEQAPASQERFTRMYDSPTPSFDIGYFVDDLAGDSNVVLMLDSVAYADRNLTIDRIAGGLMTSLLDAGWELQDIASDQNFLVFGGGER